ncbi:MAG: S41 family peptidase [Saprospiraceae bacterium]|jgi:carboxyl-terminal processing protease|uniref:S41 family peptidase n=2 Tax=Candidatus Brachybacter algidus TaxID=2982024 RepID=UPI001B63AFBC|nr:S41 family peptidase [Candidatus Brachybacter algidus]MBP7307346.1 S41 family peptidase [Saprospiraceae bacterium]MBK6372228.1 S41 family peptidase [Candidatus Brachybacter algidus]MBK6450111.1 S41 family peptidase [Candidatus Brachybacter algidus]MBK7603360.1 S41 family peptidase [Candidatus Brachybacter algidus]MBK8356768.1 S41 family peptidase [Candidatus Brachybacter algidus]
MKKALIIFTVVLSGFIGMGAAVYNNDKLFEISKNIEIFSNLFKELNTYYVDDIDPSKLMKVGIDAMVETLDPYTNYFSETQIETWRYLTEGKYEGIGANVQTIGDEITIIEPYEGCPAFEAGLKAGDVIVSIDGQSTKGKNSSDLGVLLRGVPGSAITIDVRRPGVKEIKSFKMNRGEIKMSNAPYSGIIRDHVGYVSLTTFTQDAGKNIADAIKTMKKEDPLLKGVILDLRDNGGGLLMEAINIVNIFVPNGVEVVSTRGKVRDWDKTFTTQRPALDETLPVVVLINKHSASASEIVSGAIQDLDRGVIIGQRSYGKGLVQNTKDIGFNSKLKLTTSKYYIPSGRCIQSVSYRNGEPLDVPDNERHVFRTKGGRKVLDGGGVTPDILIVPDSGDAPVKALLDNYVVFNYVTKYIQTHPTIAKAEDFKFTDFEDFMKFVESNNYPFETNSEKELKELEADAKSDEFLKILQPDLTALKNKILKEKKNVLMNHKDQINRFISKDIVTRFYNQKGKIVNSINNDSEVIDAVKLLQDPAKYNKILSKN